MKLTASYFASGAFALLMAFTLEATAKEPTALAAKAKITRAEAEKTALTKAPGGKVKEAELEEENGKLVWSFDIAQAGTKNVTEVQVDAITGKIVLSEVETPAQQEKEAKADAAASHKKQK